MLAQSFRSGGRTCFSIVTLISFLMEYYPELNKNFEKNNITLKTVQNWLETDENEKAIDDIAKFILACLSRNEPWSMGVLTFAVFGVPRFDPLSELQDRESISLGHLQVTKSEIWAPLDGYHRFRGLIKAYSQLSGKKKVALANEMVPVLLVPVSSLVEYRELLMRSRKSVRNVDRGETIRTAVNDIYATFADWLMGKDKQHSGVFLEDLINWKSNTLTNRLRQFSTLSVLYDSSKILDDAFGPISSNSSIEDRDQRYQEIADVWKYLLEHFQPFKQAVSDLPGSREKLPELRSKYLCLKPTGQLVIVSVIAMALKMQSDISLEKIVQRLNGLPWEIDHTMWKDVIVVDGRINGSVQAIKFTALFVAHLVGLPLSDIDSTSLKEWYFIRLRGLKTEELPEPLFTLMDL